MKASVGNTTGVMSKSGQGSRTQMEPELFMARLAEQAERYEDVVEYLKPVL